MAIPVNVILNEIHPLTGTRAVIPFEGAFFDDGNLKVEGSLDGIEYVTLDPVADFVFSPVYTKQLALTGADVYSYVLLRDDWEMIRLSYNVLVGPENVDVELLNRVANAEFDRTVLANWLTVPGSDSYNPSSRIPLSAEISELELFSAGMVDIKEAIQQIDASPSDVASNIQVTNLELRQSTLESDHANIRLEFNGVLLDFSDTKELFNFVNGQLRNGIGGNTITNAGFPYIEETPTNTHTVIHGLGTEWVDVTVWLQDANLVYHCDHTSTVQITSLSTVTVQTTVPTAALIVVRPVIQNGEGFLYTAPSAQTNHTIVHNLNSGYLSFSLWITDLSGAKVKSEIPVTMVDHNTITFNFPSDTMAYAVVQKPLQDAYLYKSPTVDTLHRLNHGLYNPQVTKNVWAKNADGSYTSINADIVIETQNSLIINLNSAEDIKVIVQPVTIADPSFQQVVEQRLAILEDGQSSINTQLVNIGTGGTGGTGTLVEVFNFDSSAINGTGPALIHTVVHNFNNDLVDVVVWVQGDDGFYYRDVMLISIIDLNTIQVTLTESRNVKVEVTNR